MTKLFAYVFILLALLCNYVPAQYDDELKEQVEKLAWEVSRLQQENAALKNQIVDLLKRLESLENKMEELTKVQPPDPFENFKSLEESLEEEETPKPQENNTEGTVISEGIKLELQGSRLDYIHKISTYRLILSNLNDTPVKGLKVVANIPLDYISSEPKGIFKAGEAGELSSIAWYIDELAPQKSVEILFRQKATKKGAWQINIDVIRDEKVLLQASHDFRILGIPAMHISSYDTEDPVEIGKETTYVVETRNEGTSPCTNVCVKSIIPKETEFISATGPTPYKYQSEDRKILFGPVPILQPGDKLTYKINCKAVKPGSAKHVAILTFHEFDSPIYDEEGTTTYSDNPAQGIAAMHISTYDTEDPVEVGKQTIYVIELRNEGTATATNIRLEDTIPNEMEFVSATGPTPYELQDKKVIFEPMASLEPAEKLVYKVTCKAVKIGSTKNIAQLTFDQFDNPIITEEGTSVYE